MSSKKKKKSSSRSQAAGGTRTAGASSRRTSSGRVKPEISREVIGWILVLVFLILTLGVYLRDSLGAFGTAVSMVFTGVFGFGAYVIPLYSLMICLWALFGHVSRRTAWKIAGGYVFIILLCSLLSVLNGFSLNTIKLMYHGASVKTGGVVGGVIARALRSAVGKTGSVIILIFLMIILLILITEHSLVNGVRKAGEKTREETIKVRESARVRHEQRTLIREEKKRLQEEQRQKSEQAARETEQSQSLGVHGAGQISLEETQPSASRAEKAAGDHGTGGVTDAQGFNPDIMYHGGESAPTSGGSDKLRKAVREDKKTKAFQNTRTVEHPGPYHDGIVDIPLIDNDAYVSRKISEEENADPIIISDRQASSDAVSFGQNRSSGIIAPQSSAVTEAGSSEDQASDVFATPSVSHETEDLAAENRLERSSAAPAAQKAQETIEGVPADDGTVSTQKAFEKEEFPTGQKTQEEQMKESGIKPGADLSSVRKPGPTGKYVFPPLDLLSRPKTNQNQTRREELLADARKLEQVLLTYGVEAKVVQVNRGPAVTRFELQPRMGTSVKKIAGLDGDIAMALAATSIHIEAPIPGKSAVGIEVPNKETTTVTLREVIDSDVFRKSSSKLTFALGKDIDGDVRVADIAKMPHLLIAGATGSGKSVCINSMIMSILYKASPNEVKLILIDPKVVELQVYNGIPHLLLPVVNDPKQASATLNWAVQEMTRRYKKFAQYNVRDIRGYNDAFKAGKLDEEQAMPQIVIIIDELADLMMAASKEVETSICRLAQMARAAGMHLVIATQRPSVDVITGLIKANIPSRIAFAVSSGVDSKTILDSVGAEKLLGRGDMLFAPIGANRPVRIQGTFVSDAEVEKVTAFVKGHMEAVYDDDAMDSVSQTSGGSSGSDSEDDLDEYLEDAVRLVVEKQKASISMLQRAFRIGFNRAARLMDALERRGVVGPDEGSKPRQVLMTREEWENENI